MVTVREPSVKLSAIGDGIAAFEVGRDKRREAELLASRQQAGQLAAVGDYNQAANMLMGQGDFQGGVALSRIGEQRAAAARDRRKELAERVASLALNATAETWPNVLDRMRAAGLKVGPEHLDFDSGRQTVLAETLSLQQNLARQAGGGQAKPGTFRVDEFGRMFDSRTGQYAPGQSSSGFEPDEGESAIEFKERIKMRGRERAKLEIGKEDARSRALAFADKARITAKEARRLADHKGLSAAAGPISSELPTFSNTTANFESDLEGLKTRVFINVLNEMRALSKSGGAVGAVTEKEMAKLEGAIASLSLRQGEGNLRQNLIRVAQEFEDAQRRIADAFERQYGVPFASSDAPPRSYNGTSSGGNINFRINP